MNPLFFEFCPRHLEHNPKPYIPKPKPQTPKPQAPKPQNPDPKSAPEGAAIKSGGVLGPGCCQFRLASFWVQAGGFRVSCSVGLEGLGPTVLGPR